MNAEAASPGDHLRAWADWALDVLFPRRCLECGSQIRTPRRRILCGACFGALRPILREFCPRCGRAARELIGGTCADCLAAPPHCDLGRTCFAYHAPLQSLICTFKYSSRLEVGVWLARLMAGMADHLPDEYRAADAIVPVPLHPARWAERGFNQAEILARPVARRLGIPVVMHNLRRKKDTERQAGLPAQQRLVNVRGAFEVADPDRFAGRRIVLIDDVVTTGATMNVCARVLKKAGAQAVYTLALASPTPDQPAEQAPGGTGAAL